MTLSSIKKGLILNGSDSVAVARIDDAVYRLEPITEITPISITDLKAGVPAIIQLGTELSHDYRIIGVTVDIPEDNEEDIKEGTNRESNIYVRTEIRIVSQNKAVENLVLNLSSYPAYINPMFINHNDVWKVKAYRDVDKITFRCVPIIMNKPITFSGHRELVDDDDKDDKKDKDKR